MPKKYHIETKLAPPRFQPVGKFATIEMREECAGSCKNCVKKNCVHEVFKEYYTHISAMPEPEFLYTCQSCFRCVQECTKGIFTRVVNPEYKTLGDNYWTPEIIQSTWFQAHTGRVPVSGAGYRGKFAGTGFDAMWTDMSEIVRPTRDGIHGREYISTSIELSRRPLRLNFTPDGALSEGLPRIMEIPLPLLLQLPSFSDFGGNVLVALARTAHELGTLLLLDAEDCYPLADYADAVAPLLKLGNYRRHAGLIRRSRMVEIADETSLEAEFDRLRLFRPDLVIAVGLPLDSRAPARAVELARHDIDTLHFYASDHGQEVGTTSPRTLRDMIRQVHAALVEAGLRPAVNLLFSGGIALAEHMAKAIICGADGVVVDTPLLIALECRVCQPCRLPEGCPVKINDIDPDWGRQRMVNLIGAWHSQLLEVMGACGIREARRLRGEAGRALFMEDLEKASFAPIFGTRQVGCG